VELVEGKTALPAGRALDLGCGTGNEVAYLARHGWTATGVDLVQIAIDRAATKIEGLPNAAVRLGDVTKLGEMGLDGPFDLVLDFGMLSFPSTRRTGCVRGGRRFADGVGGGAVHVCVRRAVAVELGGDRRHAGRDARPIRTVV
jgi:SAM-dependent methyltransferase